MVVKSGSRATGSRPVRRLPPAAAAAPYVEPPPPPPPQVEVMPAPRPGWVWIPGVHEWRDGRYVWVPGRWEHERRGRDVAAGHWERREGRQVWVEGELAVAGGTRLPPRVPHL